MPKEAKVDDIELDKRIRVVQEYLLLDYSKGDIAAQCVAKWGVSTRQGYNYIEKAYAAWEEINEKERKRLQKYHVQRRMKLLRNMDPAEAKTAAGTRAALEVLKDLAKFQGVAPSEKVEHTGPEGAPIQTETKHEVIFRNYGKGDQSGV